MHSLPTRAVCAVRRHAERVPCLPCGDELPLGRDDGTVALSNRHVFGCHRGVRLLELHCRHVPGLRGAGRV